MNIKHKEELPVGNLHNTLSAGSSVKGDITTETDFRLDGIVEGDIHCQGKIVVGPQGRIKGNLFAEQAEILGKVEGAVHVDEKLVLKATASIEGDITAQLLEIEPNAYFNGICKMSNQKAQHESAKGKEKVK